jgi:hypothetical protein
VGTAMWEPSHRRPSPWGRGAVCAASWSWSERSALVRHARSSARARPARSPSAARLRSCGPAPSARASKGTRLFVGGASRLGGSWCAATATNSSRCSTGRQVGASAVTSSAIWRRPPRRRPRSRRCTPPGNSAEPWACATTCDCPPTSTTASCSRPEMVGNLRRRGQYNDLSGLGRGAPGGSALLRGAVYQPVLRSVCPTEDGSSPPTAGRSAGPSDEVPRSWSSPVRSRSGSRRSGRWCRGSGRCRPGRRR